MVEQKVIEKEQSPKSLGTLKKKAGAISSLEKKGAPKKGELKKWEEFKESPKYARSLIEASLDPLVTIGPDGKITDVNEATIKATGATKDELVGSDFTNYFTEPDKASDGYQLVFKEGRVVDYPLTIKHKNGKLMDVLYNASVFKDEGGNVLGVFAAARDVTKTKQASQYARSLIEASLDPLVTISADGKITDVNQATIDVTGVDRGGLIGTEFSSYFTEPAKADEGYRKVFKEGSVKDYPLTIRHKDTHETDVLYNASVYKDGKGNVLGVFAAARDITAQKQASQYARSLIEASLDPLVTISAEGKITDVNQATMKVTGATKQRLIGSDFSDYFTEPEKAREGYKEVFEKGEVRDYLLTIRHRTGKLTPVLYNASVYKDIKGKVLGVFAAAREIGKAELKSAQARELMRTSSRYVFKVGLSLRLGKGTVKLNERDCAKLGLNIVDSVSVKPTRKEISNRRLSAMSLSQSKYPIGTAVMNIKDAKSLGLEEEDTVYISKGNSDSEVELVEDYSYDSTPGEFETSNVPKQPVRKSKPKKTKPVIPKAKDNEGSQLGVVTDKTNEKTTKSEAAENTSAAAENTSAAAEELASAAQQSDDNTKEIPAEPETEKTPAQKSPKPIPEQEPKSESGSEVSAPKEKSKMPELKKGQKAKKEKTDPAKKKKTKKMKDFEDKIDSLR